MFGWFRKKNWKYIGYDTFHINLTNEKDENISRVDYRALFYMTDKGERTVEVICSREGPYEDRFTNHPYFRLTIQGWVKGGEFPKAFVSVPDTLGPMLSKLVQDRMMGKEDV